MTEKPSNRTTAGLRDALFDELELMRSGDGDPTRALAVANLAKQIINTAKVELEFHRTIKQLESEGSAVQLGSLQLGSPATSVEKTATEK